MQYVHWKDLCAYCKQIPLAIETNEHNARLIKLNTDPAFIDFSILIEDDVKTFKGLTSVNIREMIDSFTCKLTSVNIRETIDSFTCKLYSQLNSINSSISYGYMYQLIQIYNVDWTDVYDTQNIGHRTEPVSH